MKKFLFLIFTFFLFTSGVKADEDFAPNSKSAILIEQPQEKYYMKKTLMKN